MHSLYNLTIIIRSVPHKFPAPYPQFLLPIHVVYVQVEIMFLHRGTDAHELCLRPNAVSTASFRAIDDGISERQYGIPERFKLIIEQKNSLAQLKASSEDKQSTGTVAENLGERLASHHRDQDSIETKPESEKHTYEATLFHLYQICRMFLDPPAQAYDENAIVIVYVQIWEGFSRIRPSLLSELY
jgi:hypothetical protein